jgi:hypothetical protein
MQNGVVCIHCHTQMQYQKFMNRGLLPAELLCYFLCMLTFAIAFLNSDGVFTILGFVLFAIAIFLGSKNKLNVWVCPNCGYHFQAM